MLTATNSILSSIGQAPVTTTTSSNPQTNLVTDILNATILDVLNEEWHFNTEKNVEFCPDLGGAANPWEDGGGWGDEEGPPMMEWGNPFGQTLALPTATTIPAAEIFVDDEILRLDITDDDINRQYDITIRGNRVYDKVNHTFMWTHCIKCDVVYLAYFEEEDAWTSLGNITIPEVFKRYITHRASTRAATKLTNNSNLVKVLAQQELIARAACMEYECNQTDASFFGFDHNSHYKSYRPYQTMLRR